MTFDLAQLEKVDSSELEILDLNKQPTGVFIELYNTDSETGDEARKKHLKRLSNWYKGKRQKQNLSKAEEAEFERLSEESSLKYLAEMTKGWRTATEYNEQTDEPIEFKPCITLKGEDWDCGFENARKLYRQFPVIRRQVDKYINEDANFLPS
jgi:hypothetical protein